MMKFRNTFYLRICTMLVLSIITTLVKGQRPETKTYSSFDFFYVDNSKTGKSQALHDTLMDLLFSEVARLNVNTSRFMMFMSDYDKFRIEERISESASVSFRMDLLEKNTRLPDLDEDIRRARAAIYRSQLKVSSAFRFHYFLSAVTIQAMMEAGKPVPVNFAKEIMATFGNGGKIGEVNIYYNRSDADFSEQQLMDMLNFYNTGAFKSEITCKLTGL